MLVTGIDANFHTDMGAVIDIEVQGDFKAPVPRNVIYTVKNWRVLKLSMVKK